MFHKRVIMGSLRGAASAIALMPLAAAAQDIPARDQRERSAVRSVMPLVSLINGSRESGGRDLKGGSAISPLGGYTRLELSFLADTDTAKARERDYSAEERDWLRRYLRGKSVSRLLTLKATLNRPDIARISTLVSMTHDSSAHQGEKWATEFGTRSALTPYFRIDPDTMVEVEATLNATSKGDGSSVGAVLDLLRRAAEAVAPSTGLVNSITQGGYNKAARLVDQTLDSLFAQAIEERRTADYPAARLDGRDLATLQVTMPMGNDITPSSPKGKANLVHVGSWTIRAAKPLLSIFGDVRLEDVSPAAKTSGADTGADTGTAADTDRKAKNGANGCQFGLAVCGLYGYLTPPTILNYPAAPSISIGQALSAEARITTARDRLIATVAQKKAGNGGADNADRTAAARALCGEVADAAHRLGLNRYDAAAVVWAYANATFADDAARQGLVGRTTAGVNGKTGTDSGSCPALHTAFMLGMEQNGFIGTAPPAASTQTRDGTQPAVNDGTSAPAPEQSTTPAQSEQM